MSRDIFILQRPPFELQHISRAFVALGASVSGDLTYLCVESGFGRFYLHVDSADADFSPWSFFDPDERERVTDIVGEPGWVATITSNSHEAINAAVLGFPDINPAAVENDDGLVLPLDTARERASAGTQWLELS